MTTQDIQAFLRHYLHHRTSGFHLLAELLNGILGYTDSVFPEAWLCFGAEEIARLFVTHPLFSFEIQYPPELPTHEIVILYRAGNVLVPADVEHYAVWMYRNTTKTPQTQRLNVALNRLQQGTVERTRVFDIVSLDREMERPGEVLSMYWDACLFLEDVLSFQEAWGHHQREQAGRLAHSLVALARWYHHL